MAEPNSPPVVRVEHLSKHFGQGMARVDALRDINMDVYPGQVVGLMGPSGSGKTTLLHCIACILEPSSGRITLDGEVVYDEHWLKADLVEPQPAKIGFQPVFVIDNLAVERDATAARLQNAGNAMEQRGLARPAWAHQPNDLARIDIH